MDASNTLDLYKCTHMKCIDQSQGLSIPSWSEIVVIRCHQKFKDYFYKQRKKKKNDKFGYPFSFYKLANLNFIDYLYTYIITYLILIYTFFENMYMFSKNHHRLSVQLQNQKYLKLAKNINFKIIIIYMCMLI